MTVYFYSQVSSLLKFQKNTKNAVKKTAAISFQNLVTAVKVKNVAKRGEKEISFTQRPIYTLILGSLPYLNR